MPMIDIYAAAGTFPDIKKLATDAAALVKSVEQVPDIPMFRKNTAAFVHEMPAAAISNVDGDNMRLRPVASTTRGAVPGSPPAVPAASRTTSGGRPSPTWFGPAFRSEWP